MTKPEEDTSQRSDLDLEAEKNSRPDRVAEAVARRANFATRDKRAARRDESAAARDQGAREHDRNLDRATIVAAPETGEQLTRVGEERQAAALDRDSAAEDRDLAAEDRGQLQTELRRGQSLEEQVVELGRSNHELEAFAATAAHDLISPMLSLALSAELLERHYGRQLDATGRDMLARVTRGVERSQALIENLLVLAGLGGADLDVGPVDTATLMDEVHLDLEAAIQERGTTLEVAEMPIVLGDRSQLQRLFQNLVSNAIKFGPSGAPRVEVSAEFQDDRWCFTVADNGIGIPAVDRERVFETFTRLGRAQPGTGLGLAICKRIVEGHGGEIHSEPGIDGGTSFVFTIRAKSG